MSNLNTTDTFNLPVFSDENNSLLKKYLTPEIFNRLKTQKTATGYSLNQLIRSGVKNQDSAIGVYAGDIESYTTFAELMSPILYDYHNYTADGKHRKEFTLLGNDFNNPDPDNSHIISTRIRVGRNLKGFPLGPAISCSDRKEVEQKISTALSRFEGDLSGSYQSLQTLKTEDRKRLVEDHLLFKEGDRFLHAAGLNRDWPEGRGIFYNRDRSFLVWINEEDQLRIISMEKGGDILNVFNRLSRAVASLEKKLDFLFDKHIGYITSCPTNLGTAMRASVHIKLPRLASNMNRFQRAADGLNLQIRGVHGEHSESEGGVFDISNKRRLGLTEKECIMDLSCGVLKLIALEKSF